MHDGRLVGAITALVLGVLLLVVLLTVLGGRGSAGTVQRMAQRSNRRHGVASRWDILTTASRFAVRRQMRVLRPSFAALPWWRRILVPTAELAAPLARVGRLTVWSPIEDVTLRLGGPRVGKSGELACRILDAPGAVIATSTRTDLLEWTEPLRSHVGPAWIFNPSGVGNVDSTMTFDPLSGCTTPKTAFERARDLIAGADAGNGSDAGGEREYWTAQATRVLTALMHAAALGGASMRDVHAWASQPDTHAAETQRYLRASSEPAFEADLLQFVKTNDRTRSSITTTIMPALAWLHDPTAALAAGQRAGREPIVDTAGVTPPDDSPSVISEEFDVEALLDRSGTVYLLGAQDAQVAPLVTALTGHIARSARQLAGRRPGGRLDPPLTLCLDEAALICPIPLDDWTADMGGRNVTLHLATQSKPQLRKRWGADGAAAIVNNAATILVFGGTRDADDLQGYATLLGDRIERVATHDASGKVISHTTQRVPVLPAALIAQLRKGEVVIIRRGMPPALGTVPMVWKRRDVRAARRRQHRAEFWRRVTNRSASPIRPATETAAKAGHVIRTAR
jgi:type IV secretion system protein VirD4